VSVGGVSVVGGKRARDGREVLQGHAASALGAARRRTAARCAAAPVAAAPLALALVAAGLVALGGCYVDVMAGLHAPLGTTATKLDAPAWSLGAAVGMMGDIANVTGGEVPFAFALGWAPNHVFAEGETESEQRVDEDHFVGQWQLGVEFGVLHSPPRVANLWWSAAGSLAFSDAVVETEGPGFTGPAARGGWGWSATTGPVVRFGMSDISFRVYFEAMLSGSSVDSGATTFAGGQVRLRLHDWRVLIVGGLFREYVAAGLYARQHGSVYTGSFRRDGDWERGEIMQRATEQRTREVLRESTCGSMGRDFYGVRCR
jgi:hypothetical protein